MGRLVDIAEALLSAFATRVVLSVAILASLIPAELGVGVQLGFLALFGIEVLIRIVLMGTRIRRRLVRPSEVILLLVDVMATLSFVPGLASGASVLRLGRVARLALLLGYWGPLGRDFLQIALQRERMSQILLVTGMAALLTGAGAAVLRVADTTGIDADGDGATDTQRPDFADLLWWSFRQVEDPGNLVPSTGNIALMLVSLALTIGGLLLVAFLIGIGATLVEDLVRAGRQRPVGLRGHTVVLNVDEQRQGVLEQIAHYFQKQILGRRVALQGRAFEPPAFLSPRLFRGFAYRSGTPGDEAALRMLDVPRARRVAILAPGWSAEADAEVLAATISARRLATDAWIVAELNRPTNIHAALRAGQAGTIPVPARRLAALVLMHELIDRGRASVFSELVALEGDEVYTAVFGDGTLSSLPHTICLTGGVAAARWSMLNEFGCLLIGYLAEAGPDRGPWTWNLQPILNPEATDVATVRGLIALAPRFATLRDAARALADPGGGSDIPSLPAMGAPLPLAPVSPEPPSQVLVLGFHDDTVEMVAELLRTFPGTEITIVGDDESARYGMREAFLSERIETGARFEDDGPKRLLLRERDGAPCGVVNVRVADRYTDGMYRPGDETGRVGNVFRYDAAVLLEDRSGTGDPDAATVLGVLKILDRARGEGQRLKRVVAEVSDGAKAALLRQRVEEDGASSRFAFVGTRRLADQILAQCFFVPGLPQVLHNLLTVGDQEIFTLRPTTRTGTITFGELLVALGGQSPPMVPLGILDTEGQVRLNPPVTEPLAWDHMEALYCLGTSAPR